MQQTRFSESPRYLNWKVDWQRSGPHALDSIS